MTISPPCRPSPATCAARPSVRWRAASTAISRQRRARWSRRSARRIHVFIATSPLHREHKLGMSKQQVHRQCRRRRATGPRSTCDDVEFSAEDAMRTEPEYLAEVHGRGDRGRRRHVERARHRRLHHAGGNGRAHRLPAGSTCATSSARSSACTATTTWAWRSPTAWRRSAAGARQVECTLTGIGERAGNAALEEVVMALRTRSELYRRRHRRSISAAPVSRPRACSATCWASPCRATRRSSAKTRSRMRPASTSTACCKHRGTYEIMRPEDVGFARSQLVLGKHSGRHALRERLAMLGHAAGRGTARRDLRPLQDAGRQETRSLRQRSGSDGHRPGSGSQRPMAHRPAA